MVLSWLGRKRNTRRDSRLSFKAWRASSWRRSQLRFRAWLRVEQLEPRWTPAAASPLQNIDHFIIIYQENWSFDSLYGLFPGANGLTSSSKTSLNQIDRVTSQSLSGQSSFNPVASYDPSSLQNPPPPLDNNSNIDTRFLTNPLDPNSATAVNTLLPYNLSPFLPPSGVTGDIVHRFWHEQAQINGGAMNQFVTWSDNPGLAMSYFDASKLPEGLLAQQYTMDDNFFHAAFGGSFLNHQFLIAAAAPVYPNAPSSLQPVLDSNGQLSLNTSGQIIQDGKITPIGAQSLADPGHTFDQNYAVNTIFSKNLAPDFIGNNTSTGLLPSLNDSNPGDSSRPYVQTIGDRLDQAGVSWKWYSGGWDNALLGSPSNPANNGMTPVNDPADPLFQWHHQPFAYYDNFAPWLPNGQRNPLSAAHLQDETNFFQDLSNNTLPAVSFIKQLGPDNEHPGYTDLLTGQQDTANIVHAVQNSQDWAHTAIIITYDENGGRWDHVSAPDNNGIWGDGTRVPAIVISPYAKQHFVDHTEHDTLSILKTIEERFNLQSLNNLDAQASDLANDFQPNAHVSIGKAYVQPDANSSGGYALIVQGSEGPDVIKVSKDNGKIRVQINGSGFSYNALFGQAISRIEVYGMGGNNTITVTSDITIPAFLYGGSGNDVIQAGGGPSVLVGGKGDDTLLGGRGADLLIGSEGHDHLAAGSGSTILIAGSTKFDANPEALLAIEAEWARTDETTAQKMSNLSGGGGTAGLNGTFVLDSATVFNDSQEDDLLGGSGTDWFFAHLTGTKPDKISNLRSADTITLI
jgi:phospholipase C